MRVAFFGLAVILATTSSALAQSETCQSDPEPVLMTLSDFEKLDLEAAKTASGDAFKDIKLYQDGAKAYRACVSAQSEAIKAKGDEATSAEKATMKKLNADHDKTIDVEANLAKNFNAMLDSLCARGDKQSCP